MKNNLQERRIKVNENIRIRIRIRKARETYGDLLVNINLEYVHLKAIKVQAYVEYDDNNYKFYEQNNPNGVAHWISI